MTILPWLKFLVNLSIDDFRVGLKLDVITPGRQGMILIHSDNDASEVDILGHFGQFGRLPEEFGAFGLFS